MHASRPSAAEGSPPKQTIRASVGVNADGALPGAVESCAAAAAAASS